MSSNSNHMFNEININMTIHVRKGVWGLSFKAVGVSDLPATNGNCKLTTRRDENTLAIAEAVK